VRLPARDAVVTFLLVGGKNSLALKSRRIPCLLVLVAFRSTLQMLWLDDFEQFGANSLNLGVITELEGDRKRDVR
jgi:hypothetical protein